MPRRRSVSIMARSIEGVMESAYMITTPSALRAARPMVCIEARFAAQKAFFVRVQDGDKGYLGQIQPFAQQVDAHDHVNGALAQITHQLHTLEGIHLVMHIFYLNAMVGEIIRQVLGHLLRQRCDQHALAPATARC